MEKCIPRSFEKKWSERRSRLDQPSIIGYINIFSLFSVHFAVKVDFLQVSSKLVTPDPRLQGCMILNNRTGDSVGDPNLLCIYPIGSLPVFFLFMILSVVFLSCFKFIV